MRDFVGEDTEILRVHPLFESVIVLYHNRLMSSFFFYIIEACCVLFESVFRPNGVRTATLEYSETRSSAFTVVSLRRHPS